MARRRLDGALAARIDAEDVLSEAYLVAHRKWPEFRSDSHVSTYAWLYGIVRDCLIAAWRTHTRDRRNIHASMPWPDASSVLLGLKLVATDMSPSSLVAQDELQQRMRQTLQVLKEMDRQVLWMRHYDKLTFSEIGAVLGIAENAATLRYVRALKRLKAQWLEGNPEDGSAQP
jgi:RNA polymerase sigma-70 factor (ECF subfamily)